MKRTSIQKIGSIVKMLQYGKFTKNEIIERLETRFDQQFSISQIEKDLYSIKNDFDAPLGKKNDGSKSYYFIDQKYDFKQALFEYVCL